MPTRFAELLLQILHSDPARPDSMDFAALTPEDWEVFTTQAIHYRLAFQVSKFLKADAQRRNLTPEACLSRLDQAVRATLVRNMNQQAQLRRMQSACESAGIPFLLMKGLWLAETVYRDLRARPTGDIDLLLHPDNLPGFTRLTQQLGFSVPSGIRDLREISSGTNEFLLQYPGAATHFDVHWSLTHPIMDKPVNEELIWQRSEMVSIAGQSCRSLGLEDHLLFLCFHAAMHHRFLYVGPRAMLDIAQVITQPPRPIDWDSLAQRAIEFGWNRGTWLVLDLTREHLGVQPPPSVLNRLQPEDASDPAVREAALETLWANQRLRKSQGNSLHSLTDIRNHLTLRERWRHLTSRIFPSRAFMSGYFHTEATRFNLAWLHLKRLSIILREQFLNVSSTWLGNSHRKAELNRSRIVLNWINR